MWWALGAGRGWAVFGVVVGVVFAGDGVVPPRVSDAFPDAVVACFAGHAVDVPGKRLNFFSQ